MAVAAFLASGAHTMQVLLGNKPALDPKTAQPVGPLDGTAFLVPLAASSVVMLVVLLVMQHLGYIVGRVMGLKGSAKTKFGHTFSELCYYTMSVLCLFRLCWDAGWFWPSGWHEVMHDGRVQKVLTLPESCECLRVWAAACQRSSCSRCSGPAAGASVPEYAGASIVF